MCGWEEALLQLCSHCLTMYNIQRDLTFLGPISRSSTRSSLRWTWGFCESQQGNTYVGISVSPYHPSLVRILYQSQDTPADKVILTPICWWKCFVDDYLAKSAWFQNKITNYYVCIYLDFLFQAEFQRMSSKGLSYYCFLKFKDWYHCPHLVKMPMMPKSMPTHHLYYSPQSLNIAICFFYIARDKLARCP